MKSQRMLRSTFKTTHSIRMILPLWILQEVNSETLLPLVSAESFPQSTFGILLPWTQLRNSLLVLPPKVLLDYQSVHAKDMLHALTRVTTTTCTSITYRERRCSSPSQQELMLSSTSSGPRNQMIWNSLLSPQDPSNSGTQLMLPRSYSRMVLSVKSTPRLSSTVPHLMRMVSATLEVPTVESTFGIKSKISVLFWKLMLVKSPLLLALKVFLYPLVRMIWSLSSPVIKVNINSSDKLPSSNSISPQLSMS